MVGKAEVIQKRASERSLDGVLEADFCPGIIYWLARFSRSIGLSGGRGVTFE
jgi:hypothetical protein